MKFEITDGEATVGTLEAEAQGLYLSFCAACSFPDAEMRRILIAGQGQTADLGICVPLGESYGVQTKRTKGTLPPEPWQVYAVPAQAREVPSREPELADLMQAHLENGQIVIAP